MSLPRTGRLLLQCQRLLVEEPGNVRWRVTRCRTTQRDERTGNERLFVERVDQLRRGVYP